MHTLVRLAPAAAWLAVALPAFCASSEAATWYVAPNGSDSSSGNRDHPFASIERARDAARRRGDAQPATILLRGGVYRLAKTLELAHEDSGVTWRAAAGEHPVISGGRVITGWKPGTRNGKTVWTTHVSGSFHALWVNGERRQIARSPNTGFYRIANVPGWDPKAEYNRLHQDTFEFHPGEIPNFENPGDVEVVILMRWLALRMHIAKLDEARHTVQLDRQTTQSLAEGFGQPPVFARYYLENALELLDEPGEWYLERKSGTLYYMPMPGEEIGKCEFVAPALDQLIVAGGVERVRFEGITFAHAGWWTPFGPTAGRYQSQAAAGVPAAIQFENSREVTFERDTIAHITNYGIHFSAGCERGRILHCDFYDLGTGGIKVGEVLPLSQPPTDPARFVHDIEISDNHIHDGGTVLHQGVGIWVGQSFNNSLSHNHIHDLYYSGISVGWTWGYRPSGAHHNLIEYNDIHDLGKGWLSDLGGIYTLGAQPGTVIRYNRIHDVESAHYAGRGIYLDEGTSEVLVENNICYNTSTGGFAQNYGQKNTVRNNIFAFGKQGQMEQGEMPKARDLPNFFDFEGNIIYFRGESPAVKMPFRRKEVVMSHNVYWAGGAELKFGPLSWAEWQARGYDRDSVIADPLFVDAVHYDFRLRSGSPALKMGFRAIDWSGVGPR
jgi:hypothetical protein